MDGQTVLVTGATGFLGGVMTRQLSEHGAIVRALGRRPQRDKHIKNIPNVEIVMGDITDTAHIQDAMQGVDYVVHSAAALGGTLDLQRKVNRDGTHNVMNAAADAGVKRVVHISTISVYGYGNTQDVTEDTPPAPGHDPYSITKLEAEQVVHDIGKARTLSYGIIRPGMIYGPRSAMWTKTMFRVARRKPTIFIGSGRGSAYPIHVEDVAALALVALTHPDADGETFNCTPDPSPTWRDFIGGYARLAGHESWLGIPPILLQPVALIAGLTAPAHSQRKDAPDLFRFLQRYITYRTDKARSRLGWQPEVALDEGIASCAPYLRDRGLLD